ncbi:MAG: PD-(D/E)XK nuclease family protein [Bdellovibrionales bacterium]|nr:PD-(D/E)XK nuclease family protein [Bdellovibrionales bacterium]
MDAVPVGGLDPRAWIVVESGISREEVKERYLARGRGFTSAAIQDVASLCRHVLGPLVERDRVLGAPSRQEILRRILSEREWERNGPERAPELRRLKRQRDFYKKLDRTIQSARMTYASAAEREAQEEKLRELFGGGRLRGEIRAVIEAYETWLDENRAWDLPRLILGAVGVLGTAEIPLELPERIVVLSAKTGESRGEALWEALGRRTEVERIFVADLLGTEFATMERAYPDEEFSATWEAWHTVDDTCDRLADGLLEEYRAGTLGRNGVLLPDLPAVRRSLKRALDERGLVLKDPRDPTRLKWEESVKVALLPLDVVARRFRHEEVISFLHSSWVRLDGNPETEFAEKRKMHQEILDRGIRTGLGAYSGDRLERIRAMLELLNEAFSPRIRVDEVAGFHLAWIRRNPDFEAWVHEFFTAVWERFAGDLAVIGEARRKAPILYWLERLRLRLADATPPFEKIQYENGVEIFRLGQTPLSYPEKLWCLALPPRYTTGDNPGDYFYSDREREVLSGHFQVRSGIHEAEFRRRVLKFWLAHAREILFLDALYDWDGRERESIEPLIQELGVRGADGAPLAPVEKDSHPRWRKSYLHPTSAPPREIRLSPLGRPGERPELSASDLEYFSRCEMQGLLLRRWRLGEAKPADLDMRPDARGTLLHEAVRRLIEARDDAGRFSLTADEALDAAWADRRPKGLFQSERLAAFTKRKLRPILEAFMVQEAAYVERARTKVLALESPELRYVVDLGPAPSGDAGSPAGRDQVSIKGIPDRIDEHPDGIFLMDYKTSSVSPKAPQMIDLGYRLQMPIYALAAARHFEKAPLGIQFIELTRKGSRGSGIFFTPWNGKGPGTLTKTTARSSSLVDRPPEEVWGKLAEEIEAHTRRYVSGEVHVTPKPAKTGGPYAECDSCLVRDACGQRRFLDDRDEEEGDGSGGGDD